MNTGRAFGAGAVGGVVMSILLAMARLMGMMPMIHPRMPSPVMPPGAFMSHLGIMGPIAVFMLHMIHGAIVGRMYATVAQPARVHALG